MPSIVPEKVPWTWIYQVTQEILNQTRNLANYQLSHLLANFVSQLV